MWPPADRGGMGGTGEAGEGVDDVKFKVGARIVVKDVRYGGNFDNGDVVTVDQIGCEDDPDCYGAISPHDGMMWYLYEDEVGPATNADRIRAMSDEELADMFAEFAEENPSDDANAWYEWLTKLAEEE